MSTHKTWLRTQRVAKDQSQGDAAIEVGVPMQTFARWEQGKQRPSLDEAVALANWAGAPLIDVADAFGLVTQ